MALFRLIGMFEQNNVGIRLESPIAAFVRGLNCNSPAIEYIAEGAKAVLNAIERKNFLVPCLCNAREPNH